MKPRTLTGLTVALVALVAISWVTAKRRYSAVEGGGFQGLLEEPVDPASIQSIRAWLGSSPDSTVELARDGEGWVVASSWNWPAKAALADRLLSDLEALKGEKRSSSADVLADYEIDEELGVHVVAHATGGTELFHLVVGKTATRGGAFARRHDSNEVFLVRTSLRSSFGVWGDPPKAPDPKRWFELRTHRAERNDVDKITLRTGDAEIVLEKSFDAPAEDDSSATVDRSQWSWKADGTGEFDKAKGDGVLSTLCNLYASDVVDPSDPDGVYGLGEGARTAEITFSDGHTVAITFGAESAEEDNKSFFRVGDGMPALIYTSTANRIFPSREDLKPAES